MFDSTRLCCELGSKNCCFAVFEWTGLETVFRMGEKDPMILGKEARVENRKGVFAGCFEWRGRRRALSLGTCNSDVLGNIISFGSP